MEVSPFSKITHGIYGDGLINNLRLVQLVQVESAVREV